MVRVHQLRSGGEKLRLELGVILSLIASAMTAIFAGGAVYGQVQDQEDRIKKVESRSDQLSDMINAQALTIARIDANVTFLTEQARGRRGDRP